MKHVHFFQMNIDAHNTYSGATDYYLNILAQWDGGLFSSGKPIVFTNFILTNNDLLTVIDFRKEYYNAIELAEKHFTELDKTERLNQARAILAVEENPITERLIENHFTPIS